jgi:hypothetical protein
MLEINTNQINPRRKMRPKLSHEVTDQINLITRIPQEKRRAVTIGLKACLNEALRRHDIARLGFQSRNSRAQLRRIARAMRELAVMIDNLDDAPRALFAAALRAAPKTPSLEYVRNSGLWGLGPFFKLHLLFTDLADTVAIAPSVRPDGARRNDAFHLLIWDLHSLIVERGGGQLTLGQRLSDGELTGTLAAVLAIMRPYLPDVIPKKLPYSTVQRQLRDVRRSCEALAIAQRKLDSEREAMEGKFEWLKLFWQESDEFLSTGDKKKRIKETYFEQYGTLTGPQKERVDRISNLQDELRRAEAAKNREWLERILVQVDQIGA